MGTDQPNRPITRETTFLSFDVESNGLHGEAFAVGAVLVNGHGKVIDEFIARSPVVGELDPWVRANVLPPLSGVPETHKTAKALRTAFWKWYQAAKERADYVIVSNGYPVEARFLISCQDDDIQERYWGHPFPLLEVASLLIQVGVKPLAVRHQLVADKLTGEPALHHNPRWDAWVAVLAALWALERSGQLK